jgi:ABC-type nitrate/sulfonate/bicarbonate transport system permease component
MALRWQDWAPQVLAALRKGVVIPAHPLALDANRKLDTRRQRALARYYLDAGAGGLAVGVHTTQFAIREVGLFEPVLELAMRSAAEWAREATIMIAGLAGRTAQAVNEAQVARGLGYHAGLLSLAALKGASEDELIAHAQTVARELPLVGFYLQPAVGGLVLPVSFWRRFAAIENVVAIKIAPFNRYRTLDVVRGVVEAGAADRVTLHTGNDDHIILDLITPFTVVANGRESTVRIKGGLLGHWSVWVKRAVELLERIHATVAANEASAELLALDAQVTDCNAAIFDAANDFHGVIAGCHEILRRQGLLEERDAGARAKAGDRPGLRGLSAPQRRCLRAREFGAMALLSPILPTRTPVRSLRPAGFVNWLGTVACRTMPARSSDVREETLGGHPQALQRYALAVVSHLGLVVAWYLFVKLGEVPKFVMPSPYDTVHALLVPNYRWPENIAVTTIEIFGGYILAVVFGIGAALLFSWFRWLEMAAMPLLVSLNMIPKVALGPLIIVWFKYGIGPNAMMAFAICFFPIVLTTARGLREVEPDLLDLVHTLKGSRWQLFTKIQLPGALPYVFSGMKVAAILAVAGAIVGEFLGSDRGLGYLMLQVQVTLDTAAMFMAVILITLIGVVLYGMVLALEHMLVARDARLS